MTVSMMTLSTLIKKRLTVVIAGYLLLLPVSALASISIPTTFTANDSIHDFPKETLNFWKAVGIKAEARGTSQALDASGSEGNSSSFNFPVTSIEIGPWMKIVAGHAEGSGIAYIRHNDTGLLVALVLTNFSIDYQRKLVLADATYANKPTIRQLAIFTFDIQDPLSLHYKFPFLIIGHEKLTNLRLTPEAKLVYKQALELPESAYPYLENSFGTLTQNSSTRHRSLVLPPTNEERIN